MEIHDTSSRVAVVTRFREYYETDKYLGGLIKVNRLVYTEKFGQDVYIVLPNESVKFDKFFINGVEYKPSKEAE